MSCIYKIEASQPLLSKTEKKIAEYLIKNRKEVLTCTAQTLADHIPTSAAAIIRFSKKLGYSGFSALKLDLASDPAVDEPHNLVDQVQKEDNFSLVVKKTMILNQNILEQTNLMINEDKVNEAVHFIEDAKRIFLIGNGEASLLCQDLQQKLLRVGCNVFYHFDMYTRFMAMNDIDEGDVVIAIDPSGETKDIINLVEYAKQANAKTIAISGLGRSNLQRISDILFVIINDETEAYLEYLSLRSSALLYIDVIYLLLAQRNTKTLKAKSIQIKALNKTMI